MADIDIQEKRGGGAVWPWLLGALALVLLIWGATAMLGGDDDDFVATAAEEQMAAEPLPGTTDDAAVPMEVTQFEQQCGQEGAAQDAMGREHEHVDQCIRQMTAALDAVVQREQVNDTQLSTQFTSYRERADNLTQDPASQEHAAMVDGVFDDAASLVRSIEAARSGAAGTDTTQPGTTDTPATQPGTTDTGMTGQVGDRLQDAADQVDPNELLLEQNEEVNAFFREMASALRTLSSRQP